MNSIIFRKAYQTLSQINLNLKTVYFINFNSFATKMRQGATKNKKDSAGKRLGVKILGGGEVLENQIIVRQRGLKWKPGENVIVGRDHTIVAAKEVKKLKLF